MKNVIFLDEIWATIAEYGEYTKKFMKYINEQINQDYFNKLRDKRNGMN